MIVEKRPGKIVILDKNKLVVQKELQNRLAQLLKKISFKGGAIMKKRKQSRKMLSAALVGAMVLSLAACGLKRETFKRRGRRQQDGVTLEFQQWWGVELPDGALDDICKRISPRIRASTSRPLKQPICGYQDSDRGRRGSRNHGRCSRP